MFPKLSAVLGNQELVLTDSLPIIKHALRHKLASLIYFNTDYIFQSSWMIISLLLYTALCIIDRNDTAI